MLGLSKQKTTFFSSAQAYLSLSLLFGTWVIYIPHITEKLSMSEGQLGIVLFFGAIGSLFGTVLGKWLVSKYGEGNITYISMILQSFFVVSIFLAPTYYYLCAGYFMFGLSGGTFQVSVNAMVVTIERQFKTSIMSTCHAFFSLGGLFASGLGTIVLVTLDNAVLHVLLSAGLVISLQLLFINTLRPIKSEPLTVIQQPKPSFSKNGILIWLAFIAISVMVTEGAIADWSGLYLQDVVKAKKEWLGLGYAGFSLSMTVGRFLGDYFSNRYGALQIIIGGFVLSIIGFLFVFIPQSVAVIFGFFVIGAGFSIIVPEIYRVSANIDGVSATSGIAFMAGAGYVGFLAGPVLLGFVAESFSLSSSFIGLLGLVSIGCILVIALKVYGRKLKFNYSLQVPTKGSTV